MRLFDLSIGTVSFIALTDGDKNAIELFGKLTAVIVSLFLVVDASGLDMLNTILES